MIGKLRILVMLVIFPYLVGFAPLDSSGTFVSVSGGHGVYPTASCQNRYVNDYQEVAVSLDHRFQIKKEGEESWITPAFFTFGGFTQVGSDERTGYGTSEDLSTTSIGISTLGFHGELDWQWVGLDLGVLAADVPGGESPVLPRLGLRIGPPVFYVSSSFAEGLPLYSDGNVINLGIGTCIGPAQFLAGWGGPVEDGAHAQGIVRMRYNFKPVTIGLTLQSGGAPHSSDLISKENYGVSAVVEVRLPD